MPRETFQEFMALMESKGVDKTIRAIAISWRLESPETFYMSMTMALYESWCGSTKPVENIRAWAKSSALNAARKERQAATRHQSSHASFEELEETDSLLMAGGTDSLPQGGPAERLDALEQLDTIFRAIKTLPPAEKEAICDMLERLLGDQPAKHLSEAQRKALYRGRLSLKQQLDTGESQDPEQAPFLSYSFLKELASLTEGHRILDATFERMLSDLRDHYPQKSKPGILGVPRKKRRW